MSISKYTIEPLNENNYAMWARQIKALQIEKEYWPAISNPPEYKPAEPPVTAAGKKALADAILLDDKAKSLIILYATADVIHLIEEDARAKEVWDALESHFSSRNAARVIHLRRELASIKLSKETVASYFARAMQLKAQLAQAGHKIQDSEFRLYILSGLPPQYDTVVELQLSEDKKPLSDLLARLQLTESRVNDRPTVPQVGSALFCRYCKSQEHEIKECGKKRARDERANTVCTHCDRRGHSADRCFDKRNGVPPASSTALKPSKIMNTFGAIAHAY